MASSDRLLQDSVRASPAEAPDPATTTSLFPRSRSVSSPPPPAPGPRTPAPAPCSPAPRRSLSSPPPSLPPSLPPAPAPDLPGPFPLGSPALSRLAQRRQSQDSCSYPHSSSASVEDIPGILKNSSDAAPSVPSQPDCRTPTKSILKVDGVVASASASRSALSYEAVSSSSSTEDLARSFTDVIIDPLPSKGRRSAPEVIIVLRLDNFNFNILFKIIFSDSDKEAERARRSECGLLLGQPHPAVPQHLGGRGPGL